MASRAERGRAFEVLCLLQKAAPPEMFSFGTKREPERTAVPGGHESPSGAFKPQTGLRSKCRVFSAARARRFRRAGPDGLRHPASASCLGRHSHPAGRCPNSSSLYPPLAAVVAVANKGLLAPFNPKEDGLHTKKLAASLNDFFSFLRFEVAARRNVRPTACFNGRRECSRREPAPADAVSRHDPSREKENLKSPQIFQILKIKIIFPLNMPRVKRRAF